MPHRKYIPREGMERGIRGSQSPRPPIHVIGPSIAYIDLLHGQFSLVDKGDADWIAKWNWYKSFDYAVRRDGLGQLRLHRAIMGGAPECKIDHRNRHGLDNRRSNLRFCTKEQNSQNRGIPRNNKTGVRGVYWHDSMKKYAAQIRANGIIYRLGFCENLEDAYTARLEAELKFHGAFSSTRPSVPNLSTLSFPEGDVNNHGI